MDNPPEDDLTAVLVACVAATDVAIVIADGRDPANPLVSVNPAFEAMTGYRAADVLGRNARFLQGPATSRRTVSALGAALAAGRPARGRLLNHRADGTSWWNEMHISPVHDVAGVLTHWIGVQHDVTEQVAVEQRSAHAATHDQLTGLVNRAQFTAELEREIARADRDRRSLAVLFCDLDGFKAVNDTHGHAVGDSLLVQVAHRLRSRLREEDLAARLGGDEFLALLVDLPGDGAKAARTVVADLRRVLAAPFHLAGTGHTIRSSIGTALYPRDAGGATELVAAADAAVYGDKPGGPRPSRRSQIEWMNGEL